MVWASLVQRPLINNIFISIHSLYNSCLWTAGVRLVLVKRHSNLGSCLVCSHVCLGRQTSVMNRDLACSTQYRSRAFDLSRCFGGANTTLEHRLFCTLVPFQGFLDLYLVTEITRPHQIISHIPATSEAESVPRVGGTCASTTRLCLAFSVILTLPRRSIAPRDGVASREFDGCRSGVGGARPCHCVVR